MGRGEWYITMSTTQVVSPPTVWEQVSHGGDVLAILPQGDANPSVFSGLRRHQPQILCQEDAWLPLVVSPSYRGGAGSFVPLFFFKWKTLPPHPSRQSSTGGRNRGFEATVGRSHPLGSMWHNDVISLGTRTVHYASDCSNAAFFKALGAAELRTGHSSMA